MAEDPDDYEQLRLFDADIYIVTTNTKTKDEDHA